MYFRFATLPNADCSILVHSDGTTLFPEVRYLTASQKLQVRSGGTTLVGSLSAAITTGVWYRLELDYDDANASNLTSAYLDGTQFCNAQNGGDMAAGGVIRMGICTSATADMYIDDVAVNDGSGSAQTGLPGAGSIVHLAPNATGNENDFATATGGTAGAANNYTRVNSVPATDTAFNSTTAAGTTTIDDFNVTDASTAGISDGSPINLVQVGQRAGSNATTAASIVTRLTGSALFDSYSRSVSAGWGTTDTGETWTVDSPGGSAADFSVNGSVGLMACTNVNNSRWATIPYASANVDFKAAMSADVTAAGGSHFLNMVARFADANNCYLARLALNTDNSLTLTIRKRVSGTETLLATDSTTGSLVNAANRQFWVRFQLTGTTLSAKVWQDGVGEQATFGVTTTDASLASAGAIGFRTILSTAGTNTLPVTAAFDNFQIVGTTTESASIPVNTTAFNTHATAVPKVHKITAYTNPATGSAWTTTGLNSMQIGYRSNVSQTTQRRVSNVWALVDYIPVTVWNADGTSAGVESSSGTTTAERSLSGTSAGVEASTGVPSLDLSAGGTSAGVASSTGSLSLALSASGTSAGTESSSGVLARTAVAAGTSAGVESSAGTQVYAGAAAGTGAGTESSVGTQTKTTSVSGTSAGVGASSGSALLVQAVAGTSTATESSTGSATLVLVVSATSAGVEYSSGTVLSGGDLAGSSDGTGSSTGTSTRTTAATGTSAGVSSSTGTLAGTVLAAGTSAGLGASTGSQARVTSVSGTSAGVGSSTGTAVDGGELPGTSAGTGGSTGSASTALALSGISAGLSGSVALLLLASAANGTSAGIGSSTGTLGILVTMVGTSTGVGDTSGIPQSGIPDRFVHRPSTGQIVRPNTGTVSRPSTGSVARPDSGTVSRPNDGTVVRPVKITL